MSIWLDENSKVVYQGLTGSQGRFYGLRNRDYGTNVVAGTNPKKAGTDVDGIPIFATVGDAVDATGADVSCIFIPAPFVKDAVMEAAEGGVTLVVVIAEGVPAKDEAWFFNKLRQDHPAVQVVGPNCPGIISPGKANVGITAGHIAKAGGPVGIVSRSGTLTYQAFVRAPAERHRSHDLCRNRWRSGARHVLHRLPGSIRRRSRVESRDDDR